LDTPSYVKMHASSCKVELVAVLLVPKLHAARIVNAKYMKPPTELVSVTTWTYILEVPCSELDTQLTRMRSSVTFPTVSRRLP